MKKLLTLIIFTSAASMYGQTYTISPSHIVSTNIPFNSLSIIDIFQINTGSSPIVLKYEFLDSNMVTGWDLSLCDLGHCIPGLPLSGTMDTVPVGGQGFLGLNIEPYSIAGTGWARYYVYQDGFHATGDTLTWYVTSGTNGINEADEIVDFSVYPNPATDKLVVKTNKLQQSLVKLFVFNAIGQQVYAADLNELDSKIDISSLSDGVYFMQLRNDNKEIIQIEKFVISNK